MGPCLGKSSTSPEKLLDDMKKNKIPVIWVLGGPGSGKGTQCTMLVERYKFCHISSGDLLREEVTAQTDIGMVVEETMAKGEIVSKEIVLEILKNAMVIKLPAVPGYLIDGYPRELEQADEFEKQICSPSLIIYFEVSDETMIKRLTKRAKTSGRADDSSEEAIKYRVNTFHKVSEPVIKKYKSKVVTINAEGPTDQIFEKCCEEVNKCLEANGKQVPI